MYMIAAYFISYNQKLVNRYQSFSVYSQIADTTHKQRFCNCVPTLQRSQRFTYMAHDKISFQINYSYSRFCCGRAYGLNLFSFVFQKFFFSYFYIQVHHLQGNIFCNEYLTVLVLIQCSYLIFSLSCCKVFLAFQKLRYHRIR